MSLRERVLTGFALCGVLALIAVPSTVVVWIVAGGILAGFAWHGIACLIELKREHVSDVLPHGFDVEPLDKEDGQIRTGALVLALLGLTALVAPGVFLILGIVAGITLVAFVALVLLAAGRENRDLVAAKAHVAAQSYPVARAPLDLGGGW